MLGKAMIAKIKALILGGPRAADALTAGASRQDDVQAATAALLVEAAVMDGDFGPEERRTIENILAERFGADAASARELVAAAEQAVDRAGQLYAFTRVITKNFDQAERVEMIEMLWRVAYADGKLHDYEAGLMRRLAGLLHVPDGQSGAARKRALSRPAAGRTGKA